MRVICTKTYYFPRYFLAQFSVTLSPFMGISVLFCYQQSGFKYYELTAFKWWPSAIFDFQKFERLHAGSARRSNMGHRAKFGADRSNHCGDMVISQFLRWQLSAILDLFYVYLDHPRRVFGGLCRCAKFGWNRCISFNNKSF